MRWHFPRSREMRRAPGAAGDGDGDGDDDRRQPDWARIFAVVACRYYHLRSARPRLVEKIDVLREASETARATESGPGPGSGCRFRGVSPWNRWLRWNDSTAVFQHRDPTWCADDGLLIYAEVRSSPSSPDDGGGRYIAYDLETRRRTVVPFDTADKTVRRLRLACGVLIIEWCEREPYHRLNSQEMVHRHFSTAFDIVRREQRRRRRGRQPQQQQSQPEQGREGVREDKQPASKIHRGLGFEAESEFPWDITFRSEWKIHFLGLPLNGQDRFFSAHTATHYALYLWQPNRSPWGEEDPLEQLTVWDISSPSPYRPSLDPTGARKPQLRSPPPPPPPSSSLSSPAECEQQSQEQRGCEGPVVVSRFCWEFLEFLGLRQRHTPTLRELRLDHANVYVHEEEHRWLAGLHSSLWPPRHHIVRCTGVPFGPDATGPRWYDECCADGDVHLSFCPRAGSAARVGGTPRRRRKRRASASAVPSPPPSPSPPSPSPTTSGAGGKALDVVDEDGTTSWPGWAPCWRHEEFPYLTVSDVVDAGAGVRIVARQCFMMEALSSFVLPKISLEEEEEEENGIRDDGSNDDDDEEGGIDRADEVSEVRFADEMWSELMGKGKIVGDERWVVGEDMRGRVTIVRF
ncbi:hypothetical protein GGS23DRAFT_557449 [Durotheca rogersii]|uniref:uncharacterized protein n=1 Tax=Durotheca rogersii TaxID=419775 RepID=UPI002220E916|nr:uncharacterized protein GGS23DRAFT_557449 [Durotheca rogersii]KAI5865045.1 hypothetical protein GGS23DRAFT_557449 [Durotheca rogersii]